MNIYKNAFINSLLAVGYVALVVTFITNASKFFGSDDNAPLAGVVFLLTFVLSAAVMGTLVLGRPILWYLDGFKKEAIKLFFCTLGFLAAWLVAVSVILIVIK